MSVCKTDGVAIAQNRAGRWLHTERLPEGVDPEHEVEPAELDDLLAEERERTDVHQLASELLHHHIAIHPVSDCPFAVRLSNALRAKR